MKRGNRFIDIKGQKFGKWLVMEFDSIKKGKKAYWKCLCDCGNEKSVSGDSLRRGNTKSCGCIRKGIGNPNYKHGLKGTKAYDNACTAKYRTHKLNQTPTLTDNEKAKIQLYYSMSDYLGADWHVDHIKPISKGGLHHPDNLQVVTQEYNLQKNDKLDFREPKSIEVFRI